MIQEVFPDNLAAIFPSRCSGSRKTRSWEQWFHNSASWYRNSSQKANATKRFTENVFLLHKFDFTAMQALHHSRYCPSREVNTKDNSRLSGGSAWKEKLHFIIKFTTLLGSQGISNSMFSPEITYSASKSSP